MSNVDQTFLCITFADDTVGIMGFVTEQRMGGTVQWTRLATREAITSEIARTSYDAHKVPVKGWRFIEYSQIPVDRTYRNALRWNEGFCYDMPHARTLHRDYLRQARSRAMLRLDVAFFRAVEAGDEVRRQQVVTDKEYLRNITTLAAIEDAQTVEELKQVWPIELILAEIELPTLEEVAR